MPKLRGFKPDSPKAGGSEPAGVGDLDLPEASHPVAEATAVQDDGDPQQAARDAKMEAVSDALALADSDAQPHESGNPDMETTLVVAPLRGHTVPFSPGSTVASDTVPYGSRGLEEPPAIPDKEESPPSSGGLRELARLDSPGLSPLPAPRAGGQARQNLELERLETPGSELGEDTGSEISSHTGSELGSIRERKQVQLRLPSVEEVDDDYRRSERSDSRGFMSHQSGRQSEAFLRESGPRVWEIKMPGPVPVILITAAWLVLAAGVLFSNIYLYAYQEVGNLEMVAARAAVAQAQLHTAQVLSPAIAAPRALDMALRSGAVTSFSDYAGIRRILEPHFAIHPAIREVLIILPDLSGAVVAAPTRHGDVEIISDHANCSFGHRQSCSLERLAFNSSWYRRAMDLYVPFWWAAQFGTYWDGPFFVRENRHDVTCDELCYRPAISVIARIIGGRDEIRLPNPCTFENRHDETCDEPEDLLDPDDLDDEDGPNATAPSAFQTVELERIGRTGGLGPAVRVSMDARALQQVVRQLEETSRGEAFIGTSSGDLLAAAEMSDTVRIDYSTGVMRPAKIWELPRPWAEVVDQTMMAGDGNVKSGGVRISVWRLQGASHATPHLGEHLRVLLAVPQSIFIDPQLNAFVVPAHVVAFVPFAGTLLFALFATCWNKFHGEDLPADENSIAYRAATMARQTDRDRSTMLQMSMFRNTNAPTRTTLAY